MKRDDEVYRLRVPPHSLEAEQSVLGSLLLDNAALDRVYDLLREDHFYAPAHRVIYASIARLLCANKPADVVTVYEDCGHEIAYLNSLAQSVASAANARRYAEIVAERWRERRLVQVGDEIATSGFNAQGLDVAQRVDRAVTSLMALAETAQDREPADVRAQLGPWVDLINDMANQERSPAVPTGLTDLDRLTAGGIWPGELWVIGARPSMGKSALSLTLARSMAENYSALFMSQEDSMRTLLSRLVAAAGGVNLADLRRPSAAPQSMWGGLTDGVEALHRLNLRLDDQPSLGLLDVRRKVQQVKRRHGLHVVFVDYLQLMQGEGETRNRELGDIANGLKGAAKEFDVGIVLLSQLSRKADERSGPPQMSDLRESGDIEGAADVIGMLYREHMRRPSEDNKHYAELHVCKNKNGPTDTVSLFFDGAYQRFGNWSGPRPFSPKAKAGGGLS
jgi:replicative DNA helicase